MSEFLEYKGKTYRVNAAGKVLCQYKQMVGPANAKVLRYAERRCEPNGNLARTIRELVEYKKRTG